MGEHQMFQIYTRKQRFTNVMRLCTARRRPQGPSKLSIPVVSTGTGPNTEEITIRTSATQRRNRGNVKFACVAAGRFTRNSRAITSGESDMQHLLSEVT
jgi:hypothetical protein